MQIRARQAFLEAFFYCSIAGPLLYSIKANGGKGSAKWSIVMPGQHI
jgi:hypothetical protein